IAQILIYVPLKARTRERIVADARMDSHFMESIRSIGAIKRFSAEPVRESDWQNRFADAINARIRVHRLAIGLELLDTAIGGCCTVLIVYLGARQVLERELTVGMLYAFLAWRNHLVDATTSLVTELIKYLMLSLHMERLADIQLAEPEPVSESDPIPVEGHLALREAAFRYSPREPWVVSNCSFFLGSGESLAIFGPSGCGKTTLLAVMQNLLPLEQGELLVDGRPIRQGCSSTLRSVSAAVMQEDCLLSGSLLSNITFNDPFPDWARVQQVARLADIHDDLAALPMGYETVVGELGSVMSAGQQQRILIARALYRQPKLLFLDEGTAHLDRQTERRVMTRILRLGVPCVFTTHNKQLLPLASKVLVHTNDGWLDRRVV
ncbi:MAG: ATP-binding cassette domain-containing protein, partial [Pseudomonadales bacterium]|nr:ATP-binding cassette domain-containing protein [Pseudomonadales bacterium]